MSLQSLPERGLLERVDHESIPLFEHLERLAFSPLGQGLLESPGHVRLLGELIRNLIRPRRINQGLKGTCSVTCIETWLAEHDPGEYCRLLVGLILEPGRVTMRGGGELLRDEERLEWFHREGRRNPASRVFQVAGMEFAYPNLDYRNLEDRQYHTGPGDSEGACFGAGLDLDAFDYLLEGISGERWDTLSDKHAHIARLLARMGLDTSSVPDLKRDGLAIIEASLAEGESVFVTLDSPFYKLPEGLSEEDRQYMELPHKVRLVSLDGERVLYEDPLDPQEPWLPGVQTRVLDAQGVCSMSREDLRRILVEMSYKPRFCRHVADPA